MAATIRQWESVGELLRQIYAPTSSYLQVQQLVDLSTLLLNLKTQQDLSPAPRAIWKKLVQKKVPLRLLKAVALHFQSPGAPTPTASMAALAATHFLSAADAAGAMARRTLSCSSGGIGSSGGDGQGSAGGGSNTSSALSAAVLVQLQQSGLLQQLPVVLSATTQQLERSAAAAKAGQFDAGRDPHLQVMVTNLLALASKLLQLPPEQNNGVSFVPLPAVAGLVLSSLHYQTCMTALSAEQQQQQGPSFVTARTAAMRLWLTAMSSDVAFSVESMGCTAASRNSRGSSSGSSSTAGLPQAAAAAADAAAEQVLCSEECFLCLAVWIIGLALHLTAQQQSEGGGSSGSSSGSNGTNGSGGSSGSGGNSCLPFPLPTQLMAVLQEAGCSADVAVEVAQQTVQGMESSFPVLDSILCTYAAFAEAQQFVPELRQQQLGRFAFLHQLMCSAMLQLAPMFACTSVQRLDCCSKCCIVAWLSLVCSQQQVQAQSSSSTSDQNTLEQHRQGLDYSSCLQSAQDLLQHLLQLWGSATAALAPAEAPTSLTLPGSSSSSSRNGVSTAHQASVPAVLQGADGPVALRCISRTINVLSTSLLPLLYASREAEQSAQGASAGGQQQQQREQTFVRLCLLLSQQTRMSIEAVQTSVSSSTVALRQSGQVLATILQAAAADLLSALLCIGGSEEWLPLRKAACASSDVGSPEQRGQFDLLCSLLKLGSINSNLLQQQPGFGVSGILGMVSCIADIAILHVDLLHVDLKAAAPAAATTTRQAGSDAPLQPETAADTASGAAAADPPVEQHKAAAATAAEGSSTCCPNPTAMLPWLVLLGRCCLLWAQWMQQLSMVKHAEVASEQGQLSKHAPQSLKPTWHAAAATAAADPWSIVPGQSFAVSTPASQLHCEPADSEGMMDLSDAIERAAASTYGWLTAGSNMQQLADLGYNLQPLLAALVQLRADAAAIDTAGHDPEGAAQLQAAEATRSAERTSAIRLCPQLQVVGQALTAFAIPLACNNPSCVNASGPSEARLVSGKACVCAGCLTARFCSRACLKQHWNLHKPVCKALAATAAAAAGSQAAATAVSTQASG